MKELGQKELEQAPSRSLVFQTFRRFRWEPVRFLHSLRSLIDPFVVVLAKRQIKVSALGPLGSELPRHRAKPGFLVKLMSTLREDMPPAADRHYSMEVPTLMPTTFRTALGALRRNKMRSALAALGVTTVVQGTPPPNSGDQIPPIEPTGQFTFLLGRSVHRAWEEPRAFFAFPGVVRTFRAR